MKFEVKYIFVLASIFGLILVGSINHNFRMWGFSICIIGNIYWIWYHKKTTGDKEMLWVFVGYFVINLFAAINNYFNGCIVW